jgi:hypothetical protein
MLINCREQHPVGQGFFHSGTLSWKDDGSETEAQPNRQIDPFSYVYDCGSVPLHNKPRSDEIAKLRTERGARLNLLVLSHLHDDHVSGVPDLLLDAQVDTIIMPLLGVVERLIAFASTLVDGAGSTPFFRQLAIDPGTALAQFNPRQIIYVRRTKDGPEGSALAGDGEAPVQDGPFLNPRENGVGWRIVGHGSVSRGKPSDDSDDASPVDASTFTVDDVNALEIGLRGAHHWQLSPYVQQGVLDERVFLQTLARALNETALSLKAKLRSTSFRRGLISNRAHAKSLRTAYKAAIKTGTKAPDRDLNLTTLSLFSGPIPQTMDRVFTVVHHTSFTAQSEIHHFCGVDGRVAWLGTGDADLRRPDRLDEFLRHYGRLLDRIHTLTVPHHGSEKDSDSSLYINVAPIVCVTAAAAYKGWRHPASSVIQDIASAGALSIVATTVPQSRFVERCSFA